MKVIEIFAGFSPQEQAKHEQFLIDRFGGDMKENIIRSKNKVKHWTKSDWEQSGAAFHGICRQLVTLMAGRLRGDSPEVQEVISRHYQWLSQFWTPTAESYTGHSRLIVDSELRKAYETFHPQLPEFVADAMKIFAQKELA
jgi:hypothetical protein